MSGRLICCSLRQGSVREQSTENGTEGVDVETGTQNTEEALPLPRSTAPSGRNAQLDQFFRDVSDIKVLLENIKSRQDDIKVRGQQPSGPLRLRLSQGGALMAQAVQEKSKASTRNADAKQFADEMTMGVEEVNKTALMVKKRLEGLDTTNAEAATVPGNEVPPLFFSKRQSISSPAPQISAFLSLCREQRLAAPIPASLIRPLEAVPRPCAWWNPRPVGPRVPPQLLPVLSCHPCGPLPAAGYIERTNAISCDGRSQEETQGSYGGVWPAAPKDTGRGSPCSQPLVKISKQTLPVLSDEIPPSILNRKSTETPWDERCTLSRAGRLRTMRSTRSSRQDRAIGFIREA